MFPKFDDVAIVTYLLRAPAAERLADGHRAIDEVHLRGQQRALDAVAGEVARRKQRLQAGDAATGDQDPQRGLEVPAMSHVLSDGRLGETMHEGVS